ncbi:DUF1028 domain-containing protein [Silvanigrella sp.]|jgi:uncharacterized Ntn-hydrolase superfamily protein|uniref:DUF1028 domain-containing protein n=1 Tax=Silvanigrella sp. TaxID=2024976 RepID=UPI0037CB7CFB|nr:DUF1028 domain-containing protein [Silvanigrellaceae bacterium]
MLKLLFSFMILFFNRSIYATFSMVVIDKETNLSGAVYATCIEEDITLTNELIDYVLFNGNGFGIMITQGLIGKQSLIWYNTAEHIMFQDESYYSADFILQYLSSGDFDPSYQDRQYLIVKKNINKQFTSAVFTGSQVLDQKYSLVGETNRYVYAIAGNMLNHINVIKLMEKSFLNTKGSLNDKLIQAIYAVYKNKGLGDIRCQNLNTTSNIAFLRMYNNIDINLSKITNNCFINTKTTNKKNEKDAVNELYKRYKKIGCTHQQ